METLPTLITAVHDASLSNNKSGANKFNRSDSHRLWVFHSILTIANSLIFAFQSVLY